MRVNPYTKVIRTNTVDPVVKARIERITRIIAIIVAFVSTYGLLVKILFF